MEMDYLYKLELNSKNPPIDALIVSEIVNTNRNQISIVWNNDWKHSENLRLTTKEGKVIASTSNQVGRYFARTLVPSLYGNSDVVVRTEVDHWISFAIGPLNSLPLKKETLDYLDDALATNTWLTDKQTTLADIYVFVSLLNKQFLETDRTQHHNIQRWYKLVKSLPAVKQVLSLIEKNKAELVNSTKMAPETGGRKQEGKFIDLPGAEMGKVIVRFPPEASGYLHIGHAKAALLNQYYAEAFKGQLIMRFDDTNPAKENVEFENAILEDLDLLQIRPDRFTHSSDYFDLMLEFCTKLIKEGKAFVDDTPALTMKEQRDQKIESANRNNSVEKNLSLWDEMQKGTPRGQECCVRAKIDYKSPNGCMRDPTIYRCKPEPHPRTKTKYNVYPTYDFACPIVDSIEGVTHTLRTTEYHDRDPQFFWIADALSLRKPHIWEYSRLNMTNTVLSKRKLTWFVTEGKVDGWDDPRFPTVRGILRRGMTVEGLKQFIIAQGSSRSVVFMEWDKIWAFNKKVIDPIATRYTALEANDLVPVHVADAEDKYLTVQKHPKDASIGFKEVRVSKNILIERVDADVLEEGKNTTFINWGNLLITKIDRKNNKIEKIHAKLNLDDRNYKNTVKITWLAAPEDNKDDTVPCYAVYFDHIINKPVLGKDDDFKNFVAKDTRKEIQIIGEAELKKVAKGDIIQLQRKGFFRCDVPFAPISPLSSRQQPLVLFHIPDGHTTSSTANAAEPVNKTKSNKQTAPVPSNTQTNGNADSLNSKIITQGEKVRKLKSEKAEASEITNEVKILLALKAEYKTVTGTDWKPGMTPTNTTSTISVDSSQIAKELAQKASKVNELQKAIDQQIQEMNQLKEKYKTATGKTWTESDSTSLCTNNKDESNASRLSNEIQKQGDKVRDLKNKKAAKDVIDKEVQLLLSLKKDYKTATGKDWKPSAQPVDKPCTQASTQSSVSVDANDILDKIQKQGDKVRQLKSAKAQKDEIDKEVKVLLSLKIEYKSLTGQEWKPNLAPKTNNTEIKSAQVTAAISNSNEGDKISAEIQKQGDKVRQLKSTKAQKDVIDKEVKVLLSLKNDYKTLTGHEWKPNTTANENKSSTQPKIDNKSTDAGDKLSAEIAQQGNNVRKLKGEKASKDVIDKEVKILLSLKNDYKNLTGKEWKPVSSEEPKKKKESSPKPTSKESKQNTVARVNKADKDLDVSKTGTRLGLEVKKEENFFEWYSQVITKSSMIEYYDVSGCYILRPWSYAIWKIIKAYMDAFITSLGVEECYFPIFVTRAVLEKEKTHIADFAPEVAWVTKCGDSEMAEPIAIRPTSETVMYPAYAKWLRSDTELPLRLNQWNNVVRWEFKDPKPFLRTREFLWQEGHTAFATKAEADEEVLIILDMYARVYEDLLAIPVVKGRKTEKEKFAGGDYTTTVEAFIECSGRAIQGGTSHHLGQNFSKMFNIQIEGASDGEKTYVYQNSWGMTTRTIGVMIMVHGDDKGLVLPPEVACIQAVIVPCGITANTTIEQRETLSSECNKLLEELNKDSTLRVKADFRSNRTPGWKFNHWELKGVPVRIELGPKDLEKKQVTFVRRDTSERINVSRDRVNESLHNLLKDIQASLFNKAKSKLEEHIKQIESWDKFSIELNKKNLILAPFCGEPSCEENIKTDSARQDAGEELGTLSMGAKSLCIPFEQPKLSVSIESLNCIHSSCKNKAKFYTLFGRSY